MCCWFFARAKIPIECTLSEPCHSYFVSKQNACNHNIINVLLGVLNHCVCFFLSSVRLFSLVFIFSIIFIQLTASSKSLTTNCRCSRDKFQQLIYVIHIQLLISCAMLNTYKNAFIANLLFKCCHWAKKKPYKIACIIIQIKCTNSSEREKNTDEII